MLRLAPVRYFSLLLILVVGLATIAAAQTGGDPAQTVEPHIGRVLDSSTRHLLVSGGLEGTSVLTSRQDPRILMRLADAAARLEAEEALRERWKSGEHNISGEPRPAVDWSVSLGTGNVA